ncbi:MAG: hypothetical protein IPM77_15890 [Crocinitomicaceae bacterium]|nr:hypothetical protein [Crocinitomicaceae bacterium]
MLYITSTVFCLLIFSGCTNNQTEINTDQTDSLSENNFTQNNSDTTMITPPEPEFIFSDEGFKQKFDLRAYIDDPDEDQPTNLRESPNGKIIQKLPQGEDYMFHIISQKDGWFENNRSRTINQIEASLL